MTKQKHIEEMASDTQNAFKDGYIKGNIDGMLLARKETAKEILSRIKLYATDSKTDLIDLIDEIAKANGVEMKE